MKSTLKYIINGQSLFFVIMLILFQSPSWAKEFVIMNRVISWDINSGDAFWSFKPDASMPSNWVTPDNFYNGTVYTRYEVLKVATNEPFGMQFDLFQWKNPEHTIEGELCESVRWMNNGAGTVVESSSSPSTWWNYNGGVDFSKIADLQSLSITIWCNNPQAPISKAFQGGDDAGIAWSKRFNWFPVELRVTVIAVSSGSAFSGWDNYIADPVDQQPKPAYGVDFINETTDQAVPITDEYSMFPEMTYSVNGTGAPVQLTPGRRYYFRTKSGDGLLASPLQILDVPERPATPVFVLDGVNNRTSTTVNDTYEYSDYSDMNDAVNGSGDYVSIPAGTTKYFRKIATSGSFCSKIQALNASTKLPVAHEFVILNEVIDYPNNTDTNGFFYFWHNADMPVNWLTPDNYYNGQIYVRYEILSQKTTTPVGLQFGIWQKMLPESGELYETMSEVKILNGPGSIVTGNSSPSSWWKLNGGVDYSRMNLTWHFGINPWKVSTNQQIRQENPVVWNERNTYWFPMKVYVTVVAVASGQTFSGWENYLTIDPAPDYAIDYINETTNKIVLTTDQYANNYSMSGAVSGTGQKLVVTPGNTVYFRSKSHDNTPASAIQTLLVPARAVTPSFIYDTENQRTSLPVSNQYEYSDQLSMAGAVSGTGNYVNFARGTTKYFRKKATATSFKSEVQALKGIYAPPESPNYSIDFANERTATIMADTIEYSHNMSNWSGGNGSHVSLTPGQDVYIRIKEHNYVPASDTQHLYVPSRPAAPAFTIDYQYEETIETVGADIQYADNASMNSAATGSNQYLELLPGVPVYFRKKATTNSFASDIQTLYVPVRPAAPSFAVNFINETTQSAVTSEYLYSQDPSMTGAVSGNGQNIVLIPGVTYYFKKKFSTGSFASEMQVLNVPDRAATPSFTIDYSQEKTVVGVSSEYEYAFNAEMNNKLPGNGSKLNVTPGTNMFFRKAASIISFASLIQTIDIPERPSTPSYSINYSLVTTNEAVTEQDEYADKIDFTGSKNGINHAISLVPGTDLYFRTRATSASFSSEIQILDVPDKPSAPVFTINYSTATTNELVNDQIEISDRSDFSSGSFGTSTKLNLEPGLDLYFRQKAGTNSFSSHVFFLNVPEKNTLEYFGEDTVTTAYFALKANIKDGSEFSLDDLMVSNGTAQNLRTGNIFDVYPNTMGPVVVIISANAVSNNSFASNVIRVFYDNSLTGIPEIKEDAFIIYPNPSQDGLVYIKSRPEMPYTVNIISASGMPVRSFPDYKGIEQILDLSDLPGGIYIIKLNSAKGKITQKLKLD